MNLSQTLQNRRKELNLTQNQVAQQIHVSRQSISNWETGRTLPDINSLVLISDIYNISLDKLIKDDSNVMKKLSADTKQAENWFVVASLLSTALSIIISSQSDGLKTNILVLLLLLETAIMTYFSFAGLKFIKANKETIKKNINSQTKDIVIDMYDVLYVVTILCGVITTVLTALMMT